VYGSLRRTDYLSAIRSKVHLIGTDPSAPSGYLPGNKVHHVDQSTNVRSDELGEIKSDDECAES